jgi:transmembrane sensor
MNRNRDQSSDEAESAAVDWVVRLQSPEVGESDFLAFDRWLDQSPSHGWAFDRALALSQEFDHQRHALYQPPAPSPPVAAPRQSWRWAALAVTMAATIAVTWTLRPHLAPIKHSWQALRTTKGEHSTIVLADATRIDLSGDTKLSVRYDGNTREVAMEEGEAIFDVAKDDAHPFLIRVGDRAVHVVGTAFDVRHRGDTLSVTVERGIVEVAPLDAGGEAVRLTPGKRFDHRIGDSGAQLGDAAADEIFAWRSGRLIYRERPLSEVVADLNAQFVRPVSLDDRRLADVKFSGVLVLDDEENVVHRLTLLTPLFSSSSPAGIVLRAKEASAR